MCSKQEPFFFSFFMMKFRRKLPILILTGLIQSCACLPTHLLNSESHDYVSAKYNTFWIKMTNLRIFPSRNMITPPVYNHHFWKKAVAFPRGSKCLVKPRLKEHLTQKWHFNGVAYTVQSTVFLCWAYWRNNDCKFKFLSIIWPLKDTW